MNSKLKNNKMFLILLLILVIIIWGNFFLRVLPKEKMKKSNIIKDHVSADLALTNTSRFDNIEFKGSYPDPFLRNVVTKSEPHQNKKSYKMHFPYELVGIINDLAVIKMQNNDILYLQENDSIDIFQIVKVAQDSVIIQQSGKKQILKLKMNSGKNIFSEER